MTHSERKVLVPGPGHPITVEPTGARVTVRVGGRVLADSSAALTLQEADYPPVQYVPLGDVDQSLLRRADTVTYCPYKGDCSYYDVLGPEGAVSDAVWTYEHPYPAVAAIAGHVAFYTDRIDVAVERDG
ncbi:DUF427 domain-containing protein [Actinomadura atramentaria]|uniref:DUF427 domain-containing protein n=1 Tax=Actinomadura atramentaria TaxID=1990 RepID=UPI00035E8B1D|nr:DUF427 domain-containing protein [Actinomadura atramentaria]